MNIIENKGHNAGFASERSFGVSVLYWILGTASIYAGMFGIGFLLRLEYATGVSLMIFCLLTLVIMVRGMARLDEEAC